MLRHVGAVFLNHREVSAQEPAYRVLSMPLRNLSRTVVFVNTDSKETRSAVLKSKEKLDKIDNKAEDVFQKNIVDRYSSRPDCLDSLCLAEFAANYTTNYKDTAEDIDDSVPEILEEEENQNRLPQKITLKHQNGRMHKRKCEAVIRFRKFSKEKDSSNFYRAKLMLYLPWRNEKLDLLCGFDDYQSHYDVVSVEVTVNEQKFSENVDIIDQAIEDNEKNEPPEHVWNLVAPGAEYTNVLDQNEGVQVEIDVENEDLDANASMFQGTQHDSATDLASCYSIEEHRKFMSAKKYREIMRSLNLKQRQIVFYHRKWCKNAVIYLKEGKKWSLIDCS